MEILYREVWGDIGRYVPKTMKMKVQSAATLARAGREERMEETSTGIPA